MSQEPQATICKPCVGGSDNREQERSLNLPDPDLGLKWFDLPCIFHVDFGHFCMLGFNESLVLSLFAIQNLQTDSNVWLVTTCHSSRYFSNICILQALF